MKDVIEKFDLLPLKTRIIITCILFVCTIIIFPNILVYAFTAFVSYKFLKNNIFRYGLTIIFTLIAVSSIPSLFTGSQTSVSPINNAVSVTQLPQKHETTATTSLQKENVPKLYDVVAVIDGDTLDVSIDGKVERLRLIGIDTPETVDPRKPVQCFGKEASNKSKELLIGKKVSLQSDSTQGDRDKYDRLLRYVFLEDGTNFNFQMIEDGYAHEYTYGVPYKYQTEFKAAQTKARTVQKGLWSPTTCNGDTPSSSASKPTQTSVITSTPAPIAPPSQPSDPASQSTAKYYTSSYGSSKYYYPEVCDGWKNLSPKYLKSFDSIEALLATYPSRTKSPQCQ